MASIIVILFFFFLLFLAWAGKVEQRFAAVVSGLLFFPHIIAFRNSPYIAPQTLLLIFPLFIEYLKNPQGFIRALKKFPLKFPLIVFFVACFITAFYTSGGKAKNFYDMFRYAFDTYMFFILSYWFGTKISAEKLIKTLFIPITIFCLLGLIEFALGANYPYKIICGAFPVYQGLYDLNSSVSLSQDWRSRLCITTHHPNTLTPMLLSMFFLIIPLLKKLSSYKFYFLAVFLSIIVLLAGSRTGALCLLGLSFIFITRKVPTIIKLSIVFFGFVFLSYEMPNIIKHFDIGQGSSLTLRENQLLYALSLFAQSPITGNGTGFMANYAIEVDAYGDKIIDHSIGALESFFFRVLIDFGIIGIIAQIVIILCLLIYFFRRRKKYFSAIAGIYVTISTYSFILLSGDSVGTLRFMFTIIGFCVGNCYIADKNEGNADISREELCVPEYLENHLVNESKTESNRSEE